MKRCPKCHMTLNAHSECPVCRDDITEVSYEQEDCERYELNKYLLLYLIKYSKLFTMCVLACICIFIINFPLIKWIYIIALLCLVICYCETFYPQKANTILKNIYSEDYLEATAKITKYASGVCAVIVMLIF